MKAKKVLDFVITAALCVIAIALAKDGEYIAMAIIVGIIELRENNEH